MDWKIELVAIPVTDVDRAKAFYQRPGRQYLVVAATAAVVVASR